MTVLDPDAALQQALADFVVADETALIENATSRGVENPDQVLTAFKGIIDRWEALLKDVDRTDTEALAALARSEIYDRLDADTYGVN